MIRKNEKKFNDTVTLVINCAMIEAAKGYIDTAQDMEELINDITHSRTDKYQTAKAIALFVSESFEYPAYDIDITNNYTIHNLEQYFRLIAHRAVYQKVCQHIIIDTDINGQRYTRTCWKKSEFYNQKVFLGSKK